MTESFNFTITKATKDATPPLIALWGRSGTGKTLSALKLARGIVGPEGKIVVVDTENLRARFYADEAGGWQHLDLQPQFTPEKYGAAFRFAEHNKADIIIVDSMSHVWEGEGGVLDLAENAKSSTGKNLEGLAKWKNPKLSYKRMTNNLLRAPIPVIFCVRAKEKFVQNKDEKGFTVLKSEGDTPIMDKNFIYEMTVALHMTEEGNFLPDSKVPSFLKDVFKPGTKVSEEMGVKMIKAMGKVDTSDQDKIRLKRDAADAAMRGTEALKKWFSDLSHQEKAMIKPEMDSKLKSDATVADEKLNEEETEI